MTYSNYDYSLAFALTIAAGAATWLGSGLVFVTSSANTLFLASCLSFSAGVMILVSFVEIYADKAVHAFEDCGHTHQASFNYATLSFFGGIAVTYVLDCVVRRINFSQQKTMNGSQENSQKDAVSNNTDVEKNEEYQQHTLQDNIAVGQPLPCPNSCCDVDSIIRSDLKYNNDRLASIKSGTLSGLALALHNFPEGLAVFVSTLADPTIGLTLVIAIALHNIPEGICVAMTIYHGTNSRIKGFLWSALSGLAEPLGGVFAYVVLSSNDIHDRVNGILFGMVAGMMVYISVKELLPTAYKFDPRDKFVTLMFFMGMAMMAGSIMLFLESGGHEHGNPHGHHDDDGLNQQSNITNLILR